MIGQGRPTVWRVSCLRAVELLFSHTLPGGLLVLAALWSSTCLAESAKPQIRVRLEWGGGSHRQWTGQISVDRGRLSEVRPLGIEADVPGSMWLDEKVVRIHQPSARTYDGIEVLVTAAETIVAQFTPLDDPDHQVSISVRLDDLTDGPIHSTLDEHGNRLTLRQAPGDMLRLSLDQDVLVFGPAEMLRFDVTAHELGFPVEKALRLRVRLQASRHGPILWSHDYETTAASKNGQTSSVSVTVPLPETEGVYDVTITASQLRFTRWIPYKTIFERSLQCVVVSEDAPLAPKADAFDWKMVGEEIDPNTSNKWQQLMRLPQWERITRLSRGPLTSGNSEFWTGPLGPSVRLAPRNETSDAGWHAYPLPTHKTGQPHLLEVEFPNDVPQSLGISILEPNSVGRVQTIGRDSGIFLSEATPPEDSKGLHRLIFWPKSETPWVVLTNHDHQKNAIFGKIRVYAAGDRLPRGGLSEAVSPGRLLAAYMRRPLIPENFSATEVPDSAVDQGIDDWQTFYEGSTRLVDYLKHVGYNGLMISVLADGSTIYPSQLLQPTPRYDTGILAEHGKDPVRKDVLEFLLRLFDRDDLSLIPAIQFTAPLPRLEALRRQGGPQSVGIVWVGSDGQEWDSSNRPQDGHYYNLLNKQVQREMLSVVRELATRYQGHDSLAGLAVGLTGYGVLPDPEWGMDDVTIAQFEKETHLTVPGKGPTRFADRARFLREKEPQKTWLHWRAKVVARFHQQLINEVSKAWPEATLYLDTTVMFDDLMSRQQMRPCLPRQTKLTQWMLKKGIQLDHYQNKKHNVVFLRPGLFSPFSNLAAQAADLEVQGALQLDRRLAQTASPGSLFFHRPKRFRLSSFDLQRPWKNGGIPVTFVSQPLPAGAANRQRFVHSLATLDSRSIFDGGNVLSMGQEDSLLQIFQIYQQLPASNVKTKTSHEQSVTIRTLQGKNNTWVYLVNNAPWPVFVRLPLRASPTCQWKELGKNDPPRLLTLRGEPPSWRVALRPYDLVASRFNEANVETGRAQVDTDEAITTRLESRIDDLGNRVAALKNQPSLDVLDNPDFESPSEDTSVPGWQVTVKDHTSRAEVDQVTYHERLSMDHREMQSCRLTNKDGWISLRSNLFDVPQTGRITMSVWLRSEVHQPKTTLRMALEGTQEGRPFYRSAWIGGTQQDTNALNPEWTWYLVQFEDLPASQVEKVRLRFDLVGFGTVWIDDVEIYHLYFDKNNELKELLKIITLAKGALKNQKLDACQRLLEGYWPRFLVKHVPPIQPRLARQVRTPANDTHIRTKPSEPPNKGYRFKDFLPKWFF